MRLSTYTLLLALGGACAPAGITGTGPSSGEDLDLANAAPEAAVPLLVAADEPPFAVEVPDDQPARAVEAFQEDPAFASLREALAEAGLDDAEAAVAAASVDRTGHATDPALARWRADRRQVVLTARDFLDALETREAQLDVVVDRDALERDTALLSVAALPIDDERGAP
ncbi:MAG: hypothetical protein H6721_22425 [Sandaracinus sp.]|nr:hypothetical protein [Sandaracinus sp.]MCB9621522.1 hypothetical protein [Sandaracinus sp.]MCB9634892.1 hypothetical protein [Sandaracinus sp.]